MTATRPTAPPARITLRTLPPLIPCGEATELPGLTVRTLPERHGWEAFDLAQMESDFEPTLPMGLDGEGA